MKKTDILTCEKIEFHLLRLKRELYVVKEWRDFRQALKLILELLDKPKRAKSTPRAIKTK